MPTQATDAEVRYVLSQVAMQLLARAGEAEYAERMRLFAHDWFPEHDAIEHRRIAGQLSEGMRGLRDILAARMDRMVDKGTATCVGQPWPLPRVQAK